MKSTYLLSALEKGQTAVICALSASGAMRRRLMDIGIAPGAKIQPLFRSCWGEPTAYLIQDTVIALRREDADTVLVKLI